VPKLSAGEIAAVLDGELTNVSPELQFTDFHFDSRLCGTQCLFFAITNDKADGHRFLDQVARGSGNGAVIRRDYSGPVPAMPLIRVDDPKEAYTRLARHVRSTFSSVRYVGSTGSVGKTTTREFASQILSNRYRVYRSPGNWNNWQGLPFALLKMPADTEVALFELAMSSPGIGEIGHLAGILRPDIAVLLSVTPVHLEFLHTVENVARGKLEITRHLAADSVALLNGDVDQVLRESRRLKGRSVLFGRDCTRNDIVLKDVHALESGQRLIIDFFGIEEEFVTPRLTAAQIENLFAAIVIAGHAGMKHDEIRATLGDLVPVAGRGVISRHRGVTIVDDTYNSNPEAVRKLLRWAAGAIPGPKVAVLGDMLELGANELHFHAEIGRAFAALGFAFLVTVGERALAMADGAREAGFPANSIASFPVPEAAGAWLRDHVQSGATVLFKASRGIALERAVFAFTADEPS
jgi:UDP-N-acetylmuramoyl-tripeptide--D-alanyl-D-alanine ligase